MDGNTGKDKKTVRMRIKKDKELLISQLAKTPIVQISCEKTGVGRATYYRWRSDDKRFALDADRAIQEGSLLINDLAESQLLSAIMEKNMTAIIFWLKHHHSSYETRIELRQAFEKSEEKLSKRQQEVISQAMEHSALELPETPKEDENGKKAK